MVRENIMSRLAPRRLKVKDPFRVNKPDLCKEGKEHSYKMFRETVRADNDDYVGEPMYFKVKACTVCKKKNYIDYKKVHADA